MRITSGINKMAMWSLSPFIIPFRHSFTVGLHILCFAIYLKLTFHSETGKLIKAEVI